jgi:hypothetical protein
MHQLARADDASSKMQKEPQFLWFEDYVTDTMEYVAGVAT